MRVLINLLYLTSEHLGGSWTYSSQLVRELTSAPGPDRFIVVTNSLVSDALHISPVAGESVVIRMNAESRVRRVASETLLLRSIARDHRADIVHSGGNTLPLGTGVPGVITLHDLQYRHYPRNFAVGRRLYLRTMIPLSLRLATKIICDSEYTKQDTLSLFHVDERKIAVIHLGGLREGERARPEDVERIRRRYQLEGPFLLSVGSTLPHKNLDRMILAFDAIAREVPQQLVIAGPLVTGDCPLTRALNRTSLEADGRVRRIGFVPSTDLPGLYSAADGLVFPSRFEGFGIPAVEAMQSGCPVICSRAASLTEIVGEAGILVDPDDVEGFVRSLRQLCLDDNLRARLREAGEHRARRFSWRAMAEETRKVFYEAAGLWAPTIENSTATLTPQLNAGGGAEKPG